MCVCLCVHPQKDLGAIFSFNFAGIGGEKERTKASQNERRVSGALSLRCPAKAVAASSCVFTRGRAAKPTGNVQRGKKKEEQRVRAREETLGVCGSSIGREGYR